ncbi:MAG: hypothetical protein RJA99_154 [Pseudomonadota bacterium]|jgi:aspartyl-tRNA(Asn)/glutamyl-tRNA(Gln) amidotransferase subunit A
MTDAFDDIVAAREALARGEVCARELVAAALARADRAQPRLNAFVAIEPEAALEAAGAADARRAAGHAPRPLDGIPFGFKDMFYRAGRVSACGSAIRRDWVATETATTVERILGAGAACLGRLHMTEFAAGPTGHNEHFGPCRNPWNPERIPGGSSSGPGAALAAGLVLGALGSDTGGSVRLPAAMCGVTALFPTRGRISRHGTMPLAPSMDAVGPMARSARDCRLLFSLLAGPDPRDAGTRADGAARPRPPASFAGLRIGVPRAPFAPAPEGAARAAFERSLDTMRQAGAAIVEVELPWVTESLALGGTITRAESAAAHAEWLERDPSRYGRIPRFRFGVGLTVSARDYIDALALRGRVAETFSQAVFSRCDVLHLPTYWRGAPPIAELEPDDTNLESIWARIGDWTRPFNYLGCPAVALPCGLDDEGLPLGMQLLGRPYDDERLLAVAEAFQTLTDWHRRRPPEPAIG